MSIAAFYRIISGELYTSWYYHELAAPFQHGAIYFSWYYSAALIYLVFKKQEPIIETIRPALIIFFLLILFLLASKLFIISTLPFILWKIVKQNRFKRRALISIAAVIIIVVAASSPFLLRMSELKNTDFEVLKQESFAYDTPFNGLTFRLLQWRFAKEILNQESAWLTGTGINSSQTVLNEHYAKSGVYTGNPDLEDKGYLEYKFHNQYLETLVSTGIPGLVILLLIILNIFFNRRYKLLFPLPVLIITTLFFFTESVLERQAGIMFFCITVLTLTNNKVTEWK